MKALQIVKPGEIRQIGMEKPAPQAGEVLLKLKDMVQRISFTIGRKV